MDNKQSDVEVFFYKLQQGIAGNTQLQWDNLSPVAQQIFVESVNNILQVIYGNIR